jgi:hypothetical protein
LWVKLGVYSTEVLHSGRLLGNLSYRCHDTEHNDNQHNDTKYKYIIYDFRHNDSRCNKILPICSMSLCRVSNLIYCYAEYRCAECSYAECRGALVRHLTIHMQSKLQRGFLGATLRILRGFPNLNITDAQVK